MIPGIATESKRKFNPSTILIIANFDGGVPFSTAFRKNSLSNFPRKVIIPSIKNVTNETAMMLIGKI